MRCFVLTLLFCCAASGQAAGQFLIQPTHDGQDKDQETLSAREQVVFAYERSVNATAWLAPGFDAAFAMAHPARHQPADWRIGASGFAHLYAGYLARQSAATLAQFATAMALGEDPRYWPSRRGNAMRRGAHAAMFTLFDQRNSGRRRHAVAVSNFVAAVTAASLANTWQPAQFQNSTHLAQRTLTSFAGIAGGNLAAEFRPEMKRLVSRYSRFGRRSLQLK